VIDTLLIGGRGAIGSGLRTYLPKLDADYRITSVDLPGAEDKATDPAAQRDFVDLDITGDPQGLRKLLDGRDLVVYLARTNSLKSMNAMTDLVFESVRDICPETLIVGSSSVHAVNEAYWPFEKEPYATIATRRFEELDTWPEPLSAMMEACPNDDYGEEKAYVERWAQRFATEGHHAVSTRWGGINPRNGNASEIGYFTVWCHQEDAARLVNGCYKTHRDGNLRSGAHYFVISNNKYNIFDIETPRREVGYEPTHDSELFYE
jgi:hypothetical protein